MSACDPLIQAERRFKTARLNRSRWDLFPCRGPVVPCRTLCPVWATCRGTVKPRFAMVRQDQQHSGTVSVPIGQSVCRNSLSHGPSTTANRASHFIEPRYWSFLRSETLVANPGSCSESGFGERCSTAQHLKPQLTSPFARIKGNSVSGASRSGGMIISITRC